MKSQLESDRSPPAPSHHIRIGACSSALSSHKGLAPQVLLTHLSPWDCLRNQIQKYFLVIASTENSTTGSLQPVESHVSFWFPDTVNAKSTVLLTIRCLSISYKVCFVKFTSNRNLLSLIRFISSYTTISLSYNTEQNGLTFHTSFLSLVSYYPNLDDPLFRNWSTSCASRLCFLHHDCIDTVSLYLLC